MAGELGWAAVGGALGVLFHEVKELAAGNVMFEKTLRNLMTKLNILKPVVKEIINLNKQLGEREDESAYYESLIKEGVEQVRKCKSFGWYNIKKKISYAQKLKELDRTLELLIPFAYSKRDIKEILIRTRKTSAETQEQQGTCIGQPYQDTSQNHDVGQGWTTHIRVAVGSLLDVIKESNGKDQTALNKLKNTLQSLQPLLNEIERLNLELDLPDCEAAYYKFTIDNGSEVVRKCSQIHGFKSLCMKPSYTVKLLQLNKVLKKLVWKLRDHTSTDINMEKNKLISGWERHDHWY